VRHETRDTRHEGARRKALADAIKMRRAESVAKIKNDSKSTLAKLLTKRFDVKAAKAVVGERPSELQKPAECELPHAMLVSCALPGNLETRLN